MGATINVREQALYFTGSKLYFGEVQKDRSGQRIFVDKEDCFGVYLNEDNTNTDFSLTNPAVMILKDAIEGDAYGKDRNVGLENAGLDEAENQFINKLYEKGTVGYLDFCLSVEVLGAKITSRLRNAEAEKMFYNQMEKLTNEETIENE